MSPDQSGLPLLSFSKFSADYHVARYNAFTHFYIVSRTVLFFRVSFSFLHFSASYSRTRCFSLSIYVSHSPLLYADANIIKLSRLYYYSVTFLLPSLFSLSFILFLFFSLSLASIYALSNISLALYRPSRVHLVFMSHRSTTLRNCVILLSTVAAIFHRAFRVLLTLPVSQIARAYTYTCSFFHVGHLIIMLL